jgi:hypothetical protein
MLKPQSFFYSGAIMEGLTIICNTCERLWPIARTLTIYEQQAMESRPCPRCGAYTLSCQDVKTLVGSAERSVSWSSFAD